jgi:hypothetical protein
MNAGERESLAPLLPLLQSPAQDAALLINGLTTHSEKFVAQHATLFLAEDGRKINERTIPSLARLLSEASDRSRCRAQLVLGSRIFSAEKEPQLHLTRLGISNWETIAEMWLEFFDSDLRSGRALRYIVSDTLFDMSTALQRWIIQCESAGSISRRAEEILQNIGALDDDAWPALLDGLKSSSWSARKALLQSLCGLATLKERIPTAWIQPVIEVLRGLDPEQFSQFYVLPRTISRGLGREGKEDVLSLRHSAEVVTEIAVELAATGPTNLESVGAAAEQLLLVRSASFADVLREPDDTKLLAWLASIGGNFFTWLDGSDGEAKEAVAEIHTYPEAFAVLVRWLTETLSSTQAESEWVPKSEALLRVTAELAGLMPAAFNRLANAPRLEPLLVRAVEQHRRMYGRRAAVLLLGHLRRVTPRVVKAFVL